MRAATVVLLFSLVACHKKEADDATVKAPAAPPVKVPLQVVTEAETPEVLTLTGTIAANQRSEVTADIQGKVVAVMIERGQRVKMNEPVVRLDVQNAAMSAREAAANLQNARVQKTQAEDECKRDADLLAKGAITKSDFDRQNAACQSALAQVTAAQARTEMSSKSVTDGIVRAPFSGLVAEKNVAPGEWVSPGRALFTLVDDVPLKMALSVPEAAVRAVTVGQSVDIVAVAHPEQTFKAKVTRLGAEIDKSRALIVEATLDPGSGLVPGMFAEGRVVIGSKKHPVLPAEAVVKRGKTWHAFVDNKGELSDRIVQLGPEPAPHQVSIIQGLAAGEKVVSKVTDAVVDGLKVVE